MKKFINAYTGTLMFVADEREEEYKAAGHKPVADSFVLKTADPEKKPVKKTVKKK